MLATNPPVRVEGHHYLECTFFEQTEPNCVIVHLLNSTVRDLGKETTLDPAKIFVNKDFANPANVYSVWSVKTDL